MSDYKFLCPSCGQKISCDTSDVGRVIACPNCQVSFTIPHPSSIAVLPVAAVPAPTTQFAPPPASSAAPPPVPAATVQAAPRPAPPNPKPRVPGAVQQAGSNYSVLAIASLMCSIVVGIGWLPGIICGHLAKAKIRRNPLLDGERLATTGLILSYVGLFAILIGTTGFALNMRRWQPKVVVRNTPTALSDLSNRVVDEVLVANLSSEQAHGANRRYTRTAKQTGLDGTNHWRAAENRDAFAYVMQVLPDQAMTLNCRFKADPNQRLFDVIVDDTLVGGEVFKYNVPGDFYDVEYKIPETLTRGKKEVTVTFRSQAFPISGKLFACQILKP